MNLLGRLKRRTYEIVERSLEHDRVSKLTEYFIVGLIVLNVLAIILESFEDIKNYYNVCFSIFETFSVLVFTLEYILRVWIADLKYHSQSKTSARIKFILSPMALVDLMAILPSYITFFVPNSYINLMFLRILRLTRLLRVFKLTRYTNAFNLVAKVIKEKKEELTITVFVTFILVLVASTVMYYVEHEVNPDAFPNIAASFWWAIATLTTIGYGDVYPATAWGRFISAVIALLGIGLVALPTGIISSSFMEELNSRNRKEKAGEAPTFCPHCGKKLKE
ncbi:MAG: ion transporter [Clostridia bacterium]|nr:ion transporter [Clostridia bacterium]